MFFGLCEDSQIPSDCTPMLSKVLRVVKVLLIGQLVVAGCDLLLSFEGAIMMLVQTLVLYYAWSNKSLCLSTLYMVLALMTILQTCFVVVNYLPRYGTMKSHDVGVLLYSLKLPFFLLAVYYTFLLSRELKAIHAEGRGADYSPLRQPFQGEGHSIY